MSQPLAPRGHDAARREATPFGRSVQTCPEGTGHQQTGCHSPAPTHVYTHMRTYRHSTHMHTHTHARTHARTQTHTHTHTHTHTRARAHTYTHAHTDAHAHAHAHTHTHTHTHRHREREREKAHVSLQEWYDLGVEQLIWLCYLHGYRLATVRPTLSRVQRHRRSMQGAVVQVH